MTLEEQMSKTERNATAEALDHQSNEMAHDELVAAIADNLRNIATDIELALTAGRSTDVLDQPRESEYLVEYLTSRWLGVQCWFGKAETDKTKTGLGRLVGQMAGMLRSYRGSEIEDTRMQQKQSYIDDREHQLDIVGAIRQASEIVYLEMTGMEYGPATGTGKAAQTAAAAAAEALLAKYADVIPEDAKPKAAKAEDDRRPAVYRDDNGTTWALDAQGQYREVA